jgi:Na+-transporting methylmalonyl-CoA/oxaloacetate decarboxylase gamma subunit
LAKIAGGGFGVTIFVMVSLAVATWVVGMVVQRYGPKETPKAKEG